MSLLVTDSLQIALHGDQPDLVNGISISAERGTITMVVGQSGSGKSLTLRAISGVLPKETFRVRGRIRFAGQDMNLADSVRDRSSTSAGMAMIFQDPAAHLNPLMTIGQHIAEVLERFEGRVSSGERSRRTRDLLAKMQFADPDRIASAYPHQLSGGQNQRATIALALASSPMLLLADEPTSSLDAIVQREIMELLHRQRAETGLTILMVTHDVSLAFAFADKVYVMDSGRIADVFDPSAFDIRLAKPETRKLTYSAPRVVSSRSEPVDAPPIIQTSGLSKTFARSDIAALAPISLSIARGSITAIVGESGSGKTTLGRLLVGLISPTSGEFSVIGKRSSKSVRAKTIQMIFQDPATSLDPERPVRVLLTETMQVNNVGISISDRYERAIALLNKVGLPDAVIDARPMDLSGGERQRVAIARALCAEPEVLICDESVSALDPHIQGEVIGLMSDLRRDLDLTIVFITHDLRLARSFADDIVVLKDGQFVEGGPVEVVCSNPRTDYTRQLVAAQYPLPAGM